MGPMGPMGLMGPMGKSLLPQRIKNHPCSTFLACDYHAAAS